MNDYPPIIDVTPVEHSSEQSGHRARANSSSRSDSYRQPGSRSSSSGQYRANGGSTPPYGAPSGNPYGSPYGTPFGAPYTQPSTDSAASSKTAGSVVGGLAQMAVGTGLVLIGIPMLVLPGPGLLSIAGGIALAANGAHKVFG